MPKNPICNMVVQEAEAVTTEYDGKTYHFCSEGCRDRFLAENPRGRERSSYELMIIGGGPAGMTAAVYAARLALNCCVFAQKMGVQAIDSSKIKNYMGFDFITGPELAGKFEEQLLHSNYVDHQLTEVERVERREDGFQVKTSELKDYRSKALIVATGMTRRKLGVSGEEKFQRRGIFYPRAQDPSLVQGKTIAVIGGGNTAVQIVEDLRTVANDIYLVCDEITADDAGLQRISNYRNLEMLEGYKVERIEGDETVSGVAVRQLGGEDTRRLGVRGVFVAIGLKPSSSRVAHLVELNDEGEIIIGRDCSTSCTGLFAAGDVTNAFGKRIIIAAGEGAKTSLAVKQYILDLRKTGLKVSS